MKTELKYKITDKNGKVLAAFLNQSDRNLCLDEMQAVYEDAVFIPKDD